MKHSYLILIALFLFSFTQAQIVNIPDANFKNTLVNTNCADINGDGTYDGDVDTNDDGEIQMSEAEAVIELHFYGRDISSLQGIDAFINLRKLYCVRNQLSELDVSALTNLNELYCGSNQITTLNISGLSNLTALRCGVNELTTLSVNEFNNLISLDCSSNQLTTLDVSALTNLQSLSCSTNQLATLDISGLTNITSLTCYSNQLATLDVTELTYLNFLDCSRNDLSTLAVSGLSNIQILRCNDNQLATLDVSTLVNLIYLYCYDNQIAELDVSPLTSLTYLDCEWNNLTALNVRGLTNLDALLCNSNQLASIDVSTLENLRYLKCNRNQLTSLFIKNGSSFRGLQFDNNPNLTYICIDDFELEDVQSKLADYGNTNCVVNSYCNFVPGGEFYAIEGQNRFDTNSNGCDVTDPIIPNLVFNITDGIVSGSFISNGSGNYFIPVQQGEHTVTPVLENPEYFTVSPVNVVVDFPTETSPYVQDFCVISSGTAHNDLEIVIIPLEIARPGFDTDYKLIYRNKGNTIMSGTFEFNYNENADLLEFVSSTPNPESNVANVLTWSYTDLQPFETHEVFITLNNNTPTDTPPLNAGDDLGFVANIFPITSDETPSDNNFQLKLKAINSLDPNDKTCLQGETITPEQVGKFVHYMIRFENTGTASAVNIVVKDEIDMSKYDVSTLIPLDASHDFVTRIKDDNIVEFIFEDIYLPFDDANNDGYIVFKIKTLDTLELGDDFSNQAEIYFDYNAPIITNDELTTIAENLSVEESELQTIVKIYPNPVSDYLFIESKNTIKLITIYDVNGRLLQKLALTGNDSNTKIDISTLSKGLYFVSIKTDVGEQTTKIIKE